MDKNDKAEDKNFEEVARFGIYEAYIQTDYYLGFRVACENIFETCNKEIQSERPLSGQNIGLVNIKTSNFFKVYIFSFIICIHKIN